MVEAQNENIKSHIAAFLLFVLIFLAIGAPALFSSRESSTVQGYSTAELDQVIVDLERSSR